MAGLSSPGIGTGLDVNSIISKMMELERQPLTKLVQQKAAYETQISAYGNLKSSLSGLQDSLTTLAEATTFSATKATSSDSAVFTATSDSTAAPSIYNVTVNRLAQYHKMGSSEFASATTFGGGVGDEMTLTVGASSFVLDLSTAKTLKEIQEAINVSSNGTGVSAGIITGDSGNQTLVLTAKASGYDNRVQLSYGGAINAATFNLATINRDSGGVLLASDAELDASLTVDGVAVTRSSNSISDVVTGLTLQLKGKGSATTTISRDASAATVAVAGFVSAYNTLQSQMKVFSEGSLKGSRIMTSIETQIRSVLNRAASGLGAYSYIQEMGVTTTETRALKLDAADFTAALDGNLDSVTAFFTDATNGLAARLGPGLTSFLKTGGVFDNTVDGVNNRISDFERSQGRLERRLEITEQRLSRQFTALDKLVSQMSATSNFLTQQLAVLPNLFMNKK